MTSVVDGRSAHSQSQTITLAAISATVTIGNALVGTLSFSGSIAARRLRDHEREQAFCACRRFSASSQTADCGP